MLESIYLPRRGESRSINAENPTGAKGAACQSASPLGPSRKGTPCIRKIEAGSTVTLADIAGCGVIQHIWMTLPTETPAGHFVLRDLILRMYWDSETEPSVECPLGDFFLNGFAQSYVVNSQAMVVLPRNGMNCYLPMPFATAARITLENRHAGAVEAVFYQIDYCLLPEPPGPLRLHVQFRRERLTKKGVDYVLLDGVRGSGHYIGTFLALTTLERAWWGEGEMKFYMDGDGPYPTQCSTGMEDYFGGAFSFRDPLKPDEPMTEQTYSSPYLGYPFYSRDAAYRHPFFMNDCPPMRAFYRWHLPDPILFQQDLRVELQQIGLCHEGLFERQDDVASVAYWFQTEPHARFPALPGSGECWPR